MKVGFPYQIGDEVPIYENWETQDKIIGTARLVQLVRHGRSFILEDTYPESDQIVYNYDEYRVEDNMLDSWIERIRFIDSIGITNSADDEDYEVDDPKLPKDSFITINGISCF